MRVLWSIHMYPPSHNCGSEFVAHHVNKFLLTKGHECRVILHHDEKINGFIPYNYEGVDCFGSKVGTLVDSYRWADIICTHLDMTQFTIIMAASAKKPLVHFVHNDIPYSSILNSFGNVSAVYNSEWIAEKIGYNIPGFVLHPPCDPSYYNIGENKGEAITLISLNAMKGGYLFRKIAMMMPEKNFIGVIGSYDNHGADQPTQNIIVELLQELPNVQIIPNSPDILSVYRQTKILLMPSYYESWGRTATEAMCSGIPVICTPTPGLIENCKDAAIYVGIPTENKEPGTNQANIGTAEEWVKAIRFFDDKETYKKYALLCKARAAELDPEKELEGLEQFLCNAQQSYNRH